MTINDLRSLFTELILDFQEQRQQQNPETVKREIPLDTIPGKATIYMGVRRAGKSTLMLQAAQKILCSAKVENLLYINFFDERLHNLTAQDLGLILNAYFSLYPHKKGSEKIYCFFDEIQMISGWESFINRLMREEDCAVYLTGSSAKLLSSEIATQMRGRGIAWEVFPFSFQEFLTARNIDKNKKLSSKQKFIVENLFREYFSVGGFPETINLAHKLRTKVHQEYFNTILFRDVAERHDIDHPKALLDLCHLLLNNISSLYSINRLYNQLKNQGHKLSKSTVGDYITWLEDAYMLFSVPLYTPSISRMSANPRKIYSIDHTFAKSVSAGILVNSGHHLENLIFTSIRRITNKIWYYKTSSGKEVDFIYQLEDRANLIQVSESVIHPQTKKREVSALLEALGEMNLPKGKIITMTEGENIKLDGKEIEIIPAWQFLLELKAN